MTVSSKKICRLYSMVVPGTRQALPNIDTSILFDVASRLDEIAQTVPTFDQEDHDWGKDAGHFHWDYLRACEGRGSMGMGVNESLMWAIDVLLAGCHTDASAADYYIEGGTDLLDAIFEWDGTGNLYQFYQNR